MRVIRAETEMATYRVVVGRYIPGSLNWSRSVCKVTATSDKEAREIALARLRRGWGDTYKFTIQYSTKEEARA